MALQKTIYLVGPHSTGKSTLTNALREHYGENTPVLFEVARQVLKKEGYTAETIGSDKCYQMQLAIFDAQFKAEQNLVSRNKCFISDRNAIDPIVYTRMYSPQAEDWKRLCRTSKWKILVERYRDVQKSVVILLQPIKDFLKDDGTRKMPADWGEWVDFGNMFAEFLADQQIQYEVLGEDCVDIKERVEKVIGWTSV